MKEIKLPLIISITGFLLIFIINIIIGNSFSVVFLRSLIYGCAVFGIVFGINFIFKNYFGIDFDSSENFEEINTDNDSEDFDAEKSSVDFIVGDEEESNNEKSDEQPELEVGQNEYKNEPDVDELSTGENIDVKENEVKDNISTDELGVGDSFEDAFSPEEEAEAVIEEKPRMSSEDLAGNLKKKIGVDISFPDIAKAIRTKMNRD